MDKELAKNLIKDAEAGVSQAQYLVGNLYAEGFEDGGFVIEKDLKRAFELHQKSAAQNNENGLYGVGSFYKWGYYVDENEATAFEWFKKAADANKGHPLAMSFVAEAYYEGNVVPKNYGKAFLYYLKASESYFPSASDYVMLGKCFEAGNGVGKDLTKAFEYYKKAYDDEQSPAHVFLLIHCYENNIGNIDSQLGEQLKLQIKDFDAEELFDAAFAIKDASGIHKSLTARLLLLSAEMNNVQAIFVLGADYLKGTLVEKDDKKAAIYLKKAAEMGHSTANAFLGDMYRDGDGVEKDHNKAFSCYLIAAEADEDAEGDFLRAKAMSQSMVGLFYFDGDVVEKDHVKALHWLLKASENGCENSATQYVTGMLLLFGHGVKHNQVQGIEYLKKAADANHAKAQYMMGMVYYEGVGIGQDYKQAVSYFDKAVANGEADAKFRLAIMYQNGEGVRSDEKHAMQLMEEAVQQGSNEAVECLRGLAEAGDKWSMEVLKKAGRL